MMVSSFRQSVAMLFGIATIAGIPLRSQTAERLAVPAGADRTVDYRTTSSGDLLNSGARLWHRGATSEPWTPMPVMVATRALRIVDAVVDTIQVYAVRDLAGTAERALWRTTDAGGTWSRTDLPAGATTYATANATWIVFHAEPRDAETLSAVWLLRRATGEAHRVTTSLPLAANVEALFRNDTLVVQTRNALEPVAPCELSNLEGLPDAVPTLVSRTDYRRFYRNTTGTVYAWLGMDSLDVVTSRSSTVSAFRLPLPMLNEGRALEPEDLFVLDVDHVAYSYRGKLYRLKADGRASVVFAPRLEEQPAAALAIVAETDSTLVVDLPLLGPLRVAPFDTVAVEPDYHGLSDRVVARLEQIGDRVYTDGHATGRTATAASWPAADPGAASPLDQDSVRVIVGRIGTRLWTYEGGEVRSYATVTGEWTTERGAVAVTPLIARTGAATWMTQGRRVDVRVDGSAQWVPTLTLDGPVAAMVTVGDTLLLFTVDVGETSLDQVLRVTMIDAAGPDVVGEREVHRVLDDNVFRWAVATTDGVLVDAGSGGWYRSRDGGRTWTSVPRPFRAAHRPSTAWDDLVVFGNDGEREGIFLSADGGTTWVRQVVDLPVGVAVLATVGDGRYVTMGTTDGCYRVSQTVSSVRGTGEAEDEAVSVVDGTVYGPPGGRVAVWTLGGHLVGEGVTVQITGRWGVYAVRWTDAYGRLGATVAVAGATR